MQYLEVLMISTDISVKATMIKMKIDVHIVTRGSVGWACVAHLSFCLEET